MASSATRKKQDDKNLKVLRELGTLPPNKYCFECNQRGPTYVDVTIGSYVCTKCSGMLRGLTPPHRVKSISMATFTNEEIELLKARGNAYCREVWMGLYDASSPTQSLARCASGINSNNKTHGNINHNNGNYNFEVIHDEQTLRNLMVDKYERKRYYLEPKTPATGLSSSASSLSLPSSTTSASQFHMNSGGSIDRKDRTKLVAINDSQLDENHTASHRNLNINNSLASVPSTLVVDLKKTDFLTKQRNTNSPASVRNTSANKLTNNLLFSNWSDQQHSKINAKPSSTNNQFNSKSNQPFSFQSNGETENFANFDSNVIFNHLQAGVSYNGGTMLSTGSLSTLPLSMYNNKVKSEQPQAPNEDRYAALKDLDIALKSQLQATSQSTGNSTSSSSFSATDEFSTGISGQAFDYNFSSQSYPFNLASHGSSGGVFSDISTDSNMIKSSSLNAVNPFKYNGNKLSLEHSHSQTSHCNPFRDTNFTKKNGLHQIAHATMDSVVTKDYMNSLFPGPHNPFKVAEASGATLGNNISSKNPFLQ